MSKLHFCNSCSKGNVSMKFCYSVAEGNDFMKFRFQNFVLGVMSWRSSSSANPLRRSVSRSYASTNTLLSIELSVFTNFCSSTLGVMPWWNSDFTNLLKWECHHVVLQFCYWWEHLQEVPLPQLCSRGNVMSKFCFSNSAQKGISCKVPFQQSRY